MFKSLVGTTILLFAVYWVAAYWVGPNNFHSGVFKKFNFNRQTQNSGHETRAHSANDSGISTAEPTPTPLPPHFPEIDMDDLKSVKGEYVSISEAYKTCWPDRREIETPSSGQLTTLDIENLFGKIRKRELIETTDRGTKWGLLFDESVFQPHAVGSAIETPESAETATKSYRDLHLRAAGRMLHCENANSCECL